MLRLPRLSVKLRATAGALLTLVAAAAVVATPLGAPTALAAVVLATGVLACWDSPARLAWFFGALLPVDVVTGVPGEVFDVTRYALVVLLVLSFEPDLSPEGNRQLRQLAGLIGALAVIRGTFSLARGDRPAMVVAFIMAVALACAVLIGRRVRTHPHIVGGFLAGMVFSSFVALTQALDLPTLREGNQEGVRFPGLASSTSLFTWQLSFALIIAVWYLVTRTPNRYERATAWLALPLCGLALLVCGAQGGLLGLATAGTLVAVRSRRAVSWGAATRYALAGVAAAVVLGMLVVLLGVQTPTIGGLSDSDTKNEDARVQVARDGLHELARHPLTGMGDTRFSDEYGIAPHFLPIDFGVTAGVLGLATATLLLGWVASVAVRGPVGRTPSAWLGYALVAAILANALVEAGVPFAGLSRVTLLVIAVLACRGEPWDHATRARATGTAGEPLPARSRSRP